MPDSLWTLSKNDSHVCQIIADDTGKQSSAANEIAWQVEVSIAGIVQTSGAIDEVNQQASAMSETAAIYGKLFPGYLHFIRR